METTPYIWIRTRDGSPTLWNEALSESFRSVKGAFTESWAAFVSPAIEHWHRHPPGRPIQVGEFGLGPGTNWVLWTLAAAHSGCSFEYFAIERDPSSFELGRKRWLESTQTLGDFLATKGLEMPTGSIRKIIEEAPHPLLVSSIEAAPAERRADIWFHDPFGYTVNPEGYSFETLTLCRKLWAPGCAGFSYACNRRFRERVETIPGVNVEVLPTGGERLKRECLRFRVVRDDKPA